LDILSFLTPALDRVTTVIGAGKVGKRNNPTDKTERAKPIRRAQTLRFALIPIRIFIRFIVFLLKTREEHREDDVL
jgi:hypothetical protein